MSVTRKISHRQTGPERPFVKHDGGKPKWALLGAFRKPLEAVAAVAAFGAEKYARDNWRKCGDPERYYDAAQRHLWAYADGERNDPESGLPHLAHAAWCCLALLWFEERIDHDATS